MILNSLVGWFLKELLSHHTTYVLDFVAKTPALEIRIIDGDEFLQHNAFRAPGAPSIEKLREAPKKMDYLKGIYSKMHRGIVAHAVALDASNLYLLDGITFAFICMDAGESKKLVVQKLECLGVSFIDVGMGLELEDGTVGHGIRSLIVSGNALTEVTTVIPIRLQRQIYSSGS